MSIEDRPYDPQRNEMPSWIPPWNSGRPLEWTPNTPFDATMEIEEVQRGRAAANFIARDIDTDTRYPLFMTEALNLMRRGRIRKGRASGTWTVVKRGPAFSISLVTAS